jgi:hypothetical protein
MAKSSPTLLALTFGLALLTAQSAATAGALYFEKAVVKTSSEKTCLRFASDVARNRKFKNVHKSPSEVAGEFDGSYVAITCVGRAGKGAVAVVMSTSDTFDVARRAGEDAARAIKGIVCIDTPC